MDKPRTADIATFWEEFRRARAIPEHPYDVCSMGDTAQLADELLALILAGPKRATACLVRDVELGREQLAQVGGYVVVLDGRGTPTAIWRTTHVEIKPLNEVDDAFAWDEGEGDRTRDGWLRMHRKYFTRRAAAEGFTFDDSMEAVFERFTLVWPSGDAP
jgi:uncharacterized protein YhfF